MIGKRLEQVLTVFDALIGREVTPQHGLLEAVVPRQVKREAPCVAQPSGVAVVRDPPTRQAARGFIHIVVHVTNRFAIRVTRHIALAFDAQIVFCAQRV